MGAPMKWAGYAAGALGVVTAAAGVILYSPMPGPPDAAVIRQRAASYDVEIIRDAWGAPHIYGERDADAAFGLAYAHAEDDFETIQLTIAATRGRLARYQGASAAPTDFLVGFMGVWDTVERRYDTLSPQARAIAEAYADGLNLFAVEHPEAAWPGLFPATGGDVVAGFVFKTPLFYGLDSHILELLGAERAREIALGPDEAFQIRDRTVGSERGSNAFAVAAHRSGDGVTRLLINSHQPFAGPVAWYEAHLVSNEGLDIAGGVFPGAPLILHGFNRYLGWANTVNKPDLVDVYVLTRHPDDPDLYRLDDEWRAFEERTIDIEVKLFGPFTWTVRRRLLVSEHGPVVEADHGTYAVRYAGRDQINQLEQYRRLNHAASLEDWLDAMALNALPSVNYVYADASGNIAFAHNAQYPDRIDGWNWGAYLPGDRSDLIWPGYRAWADVPQLVNPASGFIYNSNNTPFSATDGADNLRAADFPSSMGLETHETSRSARIAELTDGASPLGREALLAIKFDTRYARESIAADVVEQVLANDWTSEPQLHAAADHLRNWDFDTSTANTHAALGVLTTIHAVTEPITGVPAPAPQDAFRQAVDTLTSGFGRVDPPWGDVNRFIRGSLNAPVDGGPDILRAIYPAEIRDDGRLHAAAGDTWIALVEWDAEGDLAASTVHQYGTATLDETSPHYADQAALFLDHAFRDFLMDRDDILAGAGRRYRPGAE